MGLLNALVSYPLQPCIWHSLLLLFFDSVIIAYYLLRLKFVNELSNFQFSRLTYGAPN